MCDGGKAVDFRLLISGVPRVAYLFGVLLVVVQHRLVFGGGEGEDAVAVQSDDNAARLAVVTRSPGLRLAFCMRGRLHRSGRPRHFLLDPILFSLVISPTRPAAAPGCPGPAARLFSDSLPTTNSGASRPPLAPRDKSCMSRRHGTHAHETGRDRRGRSRNQAKGAKDLGHGRLYPIRWVIAEGIPGADIQAPYWGD